MTRWNDLTIVTSCVNYGKYLPEWTASVMSQTVRAGAIRIFTHGSAADKEAGQKAFQVMSKLNVDVIHEHSDTLLDFGVARNRAVAMANTEWVMHFDADDTLMPWGIEELMKVAPTCDVVQAGYERTGGAGLGPTRRARLYTGADGVDALDLPAICSGNSPFKKSLWEQAPYRTDMLGAWDTALWIGFARIGARFRPATKPVFYYRMHADSIFNKRKKTNGWPRAHTSAMLKALRRDYRGVDVIVPLSKQLPPEREAAWNHVKAWYHRQFPEWNIIEGICPTVEWVKGRAIDDALGRAKGEVIVVADCDVIMDPIALRQSVIMVQHGAPWSQPHTMVHRANAAMTQLILRQSAEADPLIPAAAQCERPPHATAPGGGIFAMKRVNYDAIGGIPQAFRGWGSEDKALALLADTLLGPCAQGSAVLVHLFHPHQQERKQPQNNVGLLRKLGHAAQHGKDTLVSLTASLPTSVSRPNSIRPVLGVHQAVREVRQFDQKAIAERRQRLQERHRRMP